MRRAQGRDALHPEHGFGRGHLAAADLGAGIARVGPPFLADLLQPLGVDGQPEQLASPGLEPWRQAVALQVLVGQRVVGRTDAVVQRQVDAGRGLAGARHGHQHHVGLVVVHRDAVVVAQGEVHGVDAAVVGVEVHHAVGLADLGVAGSLQFLFQRADERHEHVQNQCPALLQDPSQRRVDAGADHDRPDLVALARGADAACGFMRLVRIVDERHAIGHETEAGELGQQAVAHGLGSDAGTVRDIEHRPDRRHAGLLWRGNGTGGGG